MENVNKSQAIPTVWAVGTSDLEGEAESVFYIVMGKTCSLSGASSVQLWDCHQKSVTLVLGVYRSSLPVKEKSMGIKFLNYPQFCRCSSIILAIQSPQEVWSHPVVGSLLSQSGISGWLGWWRFVGLFFFILKCFHGNMGNMWCKLGCHTDTT
jgi:hypothetical protein